MPLTEKEKNLITTTGWYESPEAMFKDIEKAVARCEQDAVKAYKIVNKVNKDAVYEMAKAEERKRILKAINNFEKEAQNNRNIYLVSEFALRRIKAELEKGDE